MAFLPPLLLLFASATAGLQPPALVGEYDGGQMEMGAGLELAADGHFHYALSYGAIDEEATGKWRADGSRVILDSDPVKPPQFSLLGQEAAPANSVRINIDVPQGMNPQYFDAVILLSDGTALTGQLVEEGLLLPLRADQHPAKVLITLSIFDLKSDVIAVDPSKGLGFRFRFEPNDLGHVDFRGTALDEDGGQLILNRYDRQIRFHHIQH